MVLDTHSPTSYSSYFPVRIVNPKSEDTKVSKSDDENSKPETEQEKTT